MSKPLDAETVISITGQDTLCKLSKDRSHIIWAKYTIGNPGKLEVGEDFNEENIRIFKKTFKLDRIFKKVFKMK